jgi:hypothetical protein
LFFLYFGNCTGISRPCVTIGMMAARMLEYTSERVLTHTCKTIGTRTTKMIQYTRSIIGSSPQTARWQEEVASHERGLARRA